MILWFAIVFLSLFAIALFWGMCIDSAMRDRSERKAIDKHLKRFLRSYSE